MADNYLEKRYQEVFGGGAGKKTISKKNNPSLDTLLLKNRSHRGYSHGRTVSMEELRTIASVNTKIPSAMNQQVLRFKLVTKESGSAKMLPLIKLGGALPELHLPLEGTEPEAFIIVCSDAPETRYVDMDLGISAQSMLLKAVEMGLNGILVCAIDKAAIKEAFELPSEPLAVLAVGKGAEKIQLLSISKAESHKYYRKEGIHYVPKLAFDEILL